MGLREKKKKEMEKKILSISKKAFLNKGYLNTSIDEIAQAAEIGVGTLYNYFQSKAELFIAVMSDICIIPEEYHEADNKNDVTGIVTDYLMRYIKSISLIKKNIWRDMLSMLFQGSGNLLLKGLMGLDYRVVEDLRRLLKELKEKGNLDEGFNVQDASQVLYDISIAQVVLYVFLDDLTLEKIEQNIASEIKFIFERR